MKIDKNIKEKFANRTLEPSASAWERLSAQLDEQPKEKKKGWFFYLGIAASILLLVSVGIHLFSNDSQEIKLDTVIVEHPIDTISINKKIEKVFNTIPVEKAIVKTERVEEKQNVIKKSTKNEITKVSSNVVANKVKQSYSNKKITSWQTSNTNRNKIAKIEETIAKNKEENLQPKKEHKIIKPNPNNSIKINSDDLLFAVTHSPTEVKEYYAKYNISKDEVLKSIKNQLKKSNFKIDPNIILAEVERTIDDDDFQNNFMRLLKKKVSDIATVIASRND